MRKGKKIGMGIGIAFAVFIALVAIGASVRSGEDAAANTQQSGSIREVATMGTEGNPATINDRVTVDSISYKVINAQIGSSIAGLEEADGQFVMVTLVALNEGKETETIYSSDFILIDSQGRRFESDNASIYLDDAIFLSQLSPGVETTGRLAFDVPKTPSSYVLEISSNDLFGTDEKYIAIGST